MSGVYTVTGHRPDKLGGYGVSSRDRLRGFAKAAMEGYQPDLVFTGMALGWDQAVAWACLELGVRYHAAIPFNGQEALWPTASQKEYWRLVKGATDQTVVCGGAYHPEKMSVRNRWMVDQLLDLEPETKARVLALWNGTEGGTANCVRYAETQEVRVVNLWGKWQAFQSIRRES